MPNIIKLSDIIKIDNLKDYKLHAARNNGRVEPLDEYVNNKESWLGWNRWKGSKNEFNRQYVFSLIDFYPEYKAWLFGGVFEVLENKPVQNDYGYEIKEVEEFACHAGRLKVQLDISRGRAFTLEKFFDRLVVIEVLKEQYTGIVFPGYENINQSFELLKPIFDNERTDWKAPLENIKGVYVIMDKHNGKRYVGSAYGGNGIWSRWSSYLRTGHGGNKDLVALIKKKGYGYAMKNFTLTLLEYYPTKKDDSFVIHRESFWKNVFLSKDFGYNNS